MPVEVIGIDHIYISVRSLERSESFYDRVLQQVMGYRKGRSVIGGDPHVHYFNRQFGFSLRPARAQTAEHDPYASGLHHFCFRVVDDRAVDRAAAELRAVGVDVTAPRHYPEYAPDYYAIFFEDPDGIRLEITNFREQRRRRMYDWDGDASGTASRREFLAGLDGVTEYESSPDKFRAFCSRCGSPVYSRTTADPDHLRIRLGLLDQDPGRRALAHVWVSSKAPWFEITDRLPQFPEAPPPRRGK